MATNNQSSGRGNKFPKTILSDRKRKQSTHASIQVQNDGVQQVLS